MASPTTWSRRWPASSGPTCKTPCRALEEDPATVIDVAAVRAESHFRGLDLNDTWACVPLFAPDANTEGNYKADLRENADVNWTDIGAKVKQLIDQRISAEVRQMMLPVSILDQDFDDKIAHLPHAEARASVMEHAIRAQIHERLEQNPVFYEHLSQRLIRIIGQMRAQLIDAAEAYRQMADLQKEVHGEAAVAARHGLSPVSLAIYEILREPSGEVAEERRARRDTGSYVIDVDANMRDVALRIEEVLSGHAVIEWRTNEDVQRQMRRDVKGSLRSTGLYNEAKMDELANLIVQVAKSRV